MKILTLLFAALLSFTSLAQAGASGEVHRVEIKKFQFIPATLTINKGDTVVWFNAEKRQYHSVWFQKLEPETDYFFPGEEYAKTFDQAGTFDYICGPHPKMTGQIIVQ